MWNKSHRRLVELDSCNSLAGAVEGVVLDLESGTKDIRFGICATAEEGFCFSEYVWIQERRATLFFNCSEIDVLTFE